MPVVVMHGGGGGGGSCNSTTKATGPNSHTCISIVTLLLNPFFGVFALIFSCWSRHAAAMDWDGARVKGRIAFWISVAGLITAAIAVLVFVLVYFTTDTT